MNPKFIEFNGKHPAAPKDKRVYCDHPRKSWKSYGASYDPAFCKVDFDDTDHKTGELIEAIRGNPRSDTILAVLDCSKASANIIQTEHGKHVFFRVPAGMERKNKQNWYCALGIKAEWKFPESDDHIPLQINGIERKFIRGSITNTNVSELPIYLRPLQKSKNKPFDLDFPKGDRTQKLGAYVFYLVSKGFTAEQSFETIRLMMNDGVQTTSELINMVYAAAQDARGSFDQMADVVARFGNNARDAFGSSEEVVAFADLIQKQMTIAGASTQEAANAELQLSQALGSGVLRGDELNSIFEQAPNLIQNIADYLDVPIGQIREMAADGELSANVVKAAIFSAADDINSKFESMPQTSSAAGILDTIFGSDLQSAVQGFQDKIQTQINTTVENAGGDKPKTLDPSDYTMDRISYGDAFSMGADFGDGVVGGISDFFNKTFNMDSVAPSVDLSDYTAGIGDGVKDIAGNTGAIKNSLNVSEDELRYLRDIAEQEVINRFTTAEITINQSNENHITNGMDLDGVISAMAEGLAEAIDTAAEGIHE